MDIDGIKVMVTGDPYPGEIEGYVRRGLREHGKRLAAMEITPGPGKNYRTAQPSTGGPA